MKTEDINEAKRIAIEKSEAALAAAQRLGDRFKPIADGKRWEIDATRSVAVHPGARGEIMLTWINGENTVNVRLSKEAAKLTALAIFTYDRNLPADMDGPPVA